MANKPYVVRKGTILYHGTHDEHLDDILGDGVEPSGDRVTAGASGVWVSPSFHDAEYYSTGPVVHLEATKDLLIHPTPSDNLAKIRRAKQLVNEEGDEGRTLTPDELKDYGYEGLDRSHADDVSHVIGQTGYEGHWDPFNGAHEMAIYNPEHLKPVGHTDGDMRFHPLNPALNGAQFNRG
jgi:hypothetical protein